MSTGRAGGMRGGEWDLGRERADEKCHPGPSPAVMLPNNLWHWRSATPVRPSHPKAACSCAHPSSPAWKDVGKVGGWGGGGVRSHRRQGRTGGEWRSGASKYLGRQPQFARGICRESTPTRSRPMSRKPRQVHRRLRLRSAMHGGHSGTQPTRASTAGWAQRNS